MNVKIVFLGFVLILSSLLVSTIGQAVVKSAAITQMQKRDGQHDFDWQTGKWKVHLRRLLNPLSGSTTWVEYNGTSVVRPVMNGRGSLLELELDGPKGHIEGVGLRLYDPESGQWSLNWANGGDGRMSTPMFGEFRDGKGEFFDQEVYNGRSVFVKNGFFAITATSALFEQAFSDDGGKTWETNWRMTFTRIK
ncbi:MAG: hypothetical protein DCC44_05310 [Acidobacteria bacterium]|nr:hypothetical protein [Pyrinomonadaceae bacterium]RIJ94115.1 MAG: hypothetical protein DCC44_05310 [Acidobacteriota bacterium]